MKKTILLLIAITFASRFSYAQWTGGPTGPIYYNGGNVGIGTTTPASSLDIATTFATNGAIGINFVGIGSVANSAFTGQNISVTNTNPGAGFAPLTGLNITATRGYAVSPITGVNVVANAGIQSGGASTVPNYGGKFVINGSTATSSAATNLSYYGLYGQVINSTAVGEVSKSYGVYGNAATVGSATAYGGYFTATGGASNFGVYSAAGTNYFNGNVGIGTNAPVSRLHVAGNYSQSAWGTLAPQFFVGGGSVQDASTAAGATVGGVTVTNSSFIASLLSANNATAGSPVTYSNAATVYISDAPGVGGSHTTITNPYAIYIAHGSSIFNGNLYSLGNVGIGTTAPNTPLDVSGLFTTGGQQANLDPASPTGNISFLKNSGHMLVGWNMSASLGETDFVANPGTGVEGGYAFYNMDNSGTLLQALRIKQTGNIGIGVNNPDAKLAVNGTVHAKEVLVDVNIFPDYVFKPTYHLPTLNEVKNYIDQNHHLPDMPTEGEVVKNGLKVGETEALLTKKVEELTLYIIAQNKRIEKLENKINHKR
jgi:hypothetical protein